MARFLLTFLDTFKMEELEFLIQRKVYNSGKARNIISDMFANGVWICYVLEDEVRNDGDKVFGETCIPAIIYDVILTMSSRFKRVMPLIFNTKDFKIEYKGVVFEGVRFHGGLTEKHSHGCPLVGLSVNEEQTAISKSAEKIITDLLIKHGGKAKLVIENKGLTGGGLNKQIAK